ncbi:MAG TPA: ferritin-like domain-containing protein [Verrucomicrobiae bacterium]|jgi:ferritin-like metal-binding protein YciE|nr:ferritin-like domain-containing protein [Verrucomicrobiae bacterium]
MSKLRETFLEEAADIYDAEKQLIRALPKMAKAAEHPELKEAFESHLSETEEHVRRLERIFEIFGHKARAKKCKAMQGLVAEGEERISDEAGDAALICAAQKVEHYEIAGYGCLRTWASLLDEEEAADLLQETFDEENAADEHLTSLAVQMINSAENEAEGEDEMEEATAHKRGAH